MAHIEMRPAQSTTHALAATARLANLPSVLGNVWLGIALAVFARGLVPDGRFWGVAAALGLAGASLYLAGGFLNDWADREWDALHRPERALPQALFAPGFYLSVAAAFGLLGLCLAGAVHRHCLIVALLIVACLVLYTWVHKRASWSVVPMGLCRALLPVLGWVGCAPSGFAPLSAGLPAVAASACGLWLHVAGLSLEARGEALDDPPVGGLRCSRILFPAAAASMFLASWLLLSLPLLHGVLGLLPYGVWMGLSLGFCRKPVQGLVANLLAAIPLVDWIVLLPLALALGAGRCPPPFPTICLLIPVLAFASGRFLQRLAPAT